MNRIALITITIADIFHNSKLKDIRVHKVNDRFEMTRRDIYYASIVFDDKELGMRLEDIDYTDERIVEIVEYETTKAILRLSESETQKQNKDNGSYYTL